MDKHEYIESFLINRFDTDTANKLRPRFKPLLQEVLLAAFDDVKDKLPELHIDLAGGSYYCHCPGKMILLLRTPVD